MTSFPLVTHYICRSKGWALFMANSCFLKSLCKAVTMLAFTMA